MMLVAAACAAGSPTTSTETVPQTSQPPPETTPTSATGWSPSATPCVDSGASGVCEVSGYPDRPYDVFVPGSYDPGDPIPVVVAFHGGGGSSRVGATMSCPGGDVDDAGCLHGLGEREGFVTVYPNGSGFAPVRKLRTWNAGGGTDAWNCASGKACANDVDDLAYVDKLLDDLGTWLNIDRTRVYATGLSNGAAFSHRLACQRAGTFAAIAAVAGSNQFSTGAPCSPERSIPVLQVHGTEDPCWTYETSNARCIGSGGDKLGAIESVTGWAERNGCILDPTESDLPDGVADGTATVATLWSGCAGGVDVMLLTVIGGGHTWPSGSPALSENLVGRVTYDWGSEVLWSFLSSYSLSEPRA